MGTSIPTIPTTKRAHARHECWEEVSREPSDQRHDRVTCTHCGARWVSNDKQRVLQHLARCPELPAELKAKYQSTQNNKRKRRASDLVGPKTPENHTPTHPSTNHSNNMNPSDQQRLSQACANWIYSCGLPFDTTEHPAFKAFIATLQPSFTPPSKQALATTLLDQAHAEAQAQTQRLEALKQSQERLNAMGDLNHPRDEPTVNYLRPSLDHTTNGSNGEGSSNGGGGGVVDVSHPLHPMW